MAHASSELRLDPKTGKVDLFSDFNVRRMFKRIIEVGHMVPDDQGNLNRDDQLHALRQQLLQVGWSKKRLDQLEQQACGWSTFGQIDKLSRYRK